MSKTGAEISTDPDAVLQLHLAEYQALTNRSTYWITLQYAFWPVLALFYTLAATVAKSLPLPAVAWGTVLGTCMLGQTYFFALSEVYNNARYIEHKLKGLIKSASSIEGDKYWLYESYLRAQRGTGVMWGEYFPVVLGIAATGTTSLMRATGWTAGDTIGLALSLIALVFIARQAINVVKVRKDLLPNAVLNGTEENLKKYE